MNTGKSIRGALSYNEQKVRQGTAELIMAVHFARDIDQMGFSEKLIRFEKINQLNEKSKTNTLHLSLNFSKDDVLERTVLQQIAADYMNRIGFGSQPYLVYKHNDTSHPHIHIVTTTIRSDGKAIYLHNLARRKSEPARKAIEQDYGLIQAETKRNTNNLTLSPIPILITSYGKQETKRSISNIVGQVANAYKFTSFDEFNAILRQYNVVADTGSPNSRMYQHGGLIYSMVDNAGNKIGIPIKASEIYGKPTLSVIEYKFEKNKIKKLGRDKYLRKHIDDARATSYDLNGFLKVLARHSISCMVNKKVTEPLQRVCFVDNKNKTTFTDKELGLNLNSLLVKFDQKTGQASTSTTDCSPDKRDDSHEWLLNGNTFLSGRLIDLLINNYSTEPEISPEFLKRKRKKKKR